MDTNTNHAGLKLAISLAGGQSALAQICGCKRQNIHQALTAGRGLPAQFVNAVSKELKIGRHVLRSDLYPMEREQ